MINEISDFEKIKDLFLNLFDEPFSFNIYSKILTYSIDNQITGFVIYDVIYDRIEIEYIGVLNKYRSNGIASQLLDYIVNYCIKSGIKNISLEVLVDNEIAINLYKKFGLKEISIRKKYKNNKDAYLMVREF